MSSNIKTMGGTKAVQKLTAALSRGRFECENYKKHIHKEEPDTKTYYLVNDNSKSVLTFREWYQRNRPEYLVSGSKKAVESFKNSTIQ